MTTPTLISPQELASRYINQTNKNVFLTGKAGTGKTTFLKSIIERTHKKAAIVAPTGIAAINAGGVTLHSLFQLPFGSFIPVNVKGNVGVSNSRKVDLYTLTKSIQMNDRKRKLIRELELLIIDEVSMLRADLLDAVDAVLRHVRYNRYQPFGGIQVLFIGDMLQLPPVVNEVEWNVLKEYYASPFFFDARVLIKDKPVYVMLDKIYRQSDETFINLLNNLRNNSVTKEDIELLNKHYTPNVSSLQKNVITLTTHNRKADSINEQHLHAIPLPVFDYAAKIEGEFNENNYPVEKTLRLKLGTQVMFVKNDPSGAQRFFNGKIGEIIQLSDKSIEVQFEDKSIVKVEPYNWQNIKFSIDAITNEIVEEVLGTYSQYPIKLAWAITVHKSQGLTFDKAVIDIGEAFAPGQVYVALSRLRSLEGLRLLTPVNPSVLLTNERVSDFSKSKKPDEYLVNELADDEIKFIENIMHMAFDFSQLLMEIKQHAESYLKAEKKSEKQKHRGWAKTFAKEFEDILQTYKEKFPAGNPVMISKSDVEVVLKEIQPRVNFLLEKLKDFSIKIYDQLELVLQVKKVKAFAQELFDLEIQLFEKQKSLLKTLRMFEACANGKEFEKTDFNFNTEFAYRIERLKSITGGEGTLAKQAIAKAAVEGKIKNPKRIKGETKLVSLKAFREGKSIEQIAAERVLATSTVYGHLEFFVDNGELEILQLMPLEKIRSIEKAHLDNPNKSIVELQEVLGKEFNYSEIRMAINQLKKNN